MKYIYTLLLLTLTSSLNYAQYNSSYCDSVRRYHGCFPVEIMPDIIGGIDSMQARVQYPAEAKNKNITGKVYVLVLVDTLGNPRCTKILKGLGYGCDKEALRVVGTARYTPAYQRGRKVAVDVSVPVYFKPPENK